MDKETTSLLSSISQVFKGLASQSETRIDEEGRTFIGVKGGVLVCSQPNISTVGYRKVELEIK